MAHSRLRCCLQMITEAAPSARQQMITDSRLRRCSQMITEVAPSARQQMIADIWYLGNSLFEKRRVKRLSESD
ncbi:MAG: hypothetical protein PHV17_00930 [Candidatus Omnitrophica bacterium]|nr:hypothetical protein [Candidatus Omnitrophota bacterium]